MKLGSNFVSCEVAVVGPKGGGKNTIMQLFAQVTTDGRVTETYKVISQIYNSESSNIRIRLSTVFVKTVKSSNYMYLILNAPQVLMPDEGAVLIPYHYFP